MTPTHKIVCATGTFKNEQGEEKTRNTQIGVLFPAQGFEHIELNASGYIEALPVNLFDQHNKIMLFADRAPNKANKRPTHSLKVQGERYTDEKTGEEKKQFHHFAVLWAAKASTDEQLTFHGNGVITTLPVDAFSKGNRIAVFPLKKEA